MKKILFNIILLTLMQSALGQTATFYDFNTSGQLSNLFNSVVQSGSVSQSTSGGIGNSGGINLVSSANAIFSTKEGYSLGPAGSSDTFESFIQSVGNAGYSGVGFTASVPVTASDDGYYRPTDAFGISVHGGGFIFHNGATNYNGSWQGGGDGITTIKAASIFDLLNNGSASDWYKLIFKMTRVTLTTFNLRVEIWNSAADGTMLDTTAAAIFEVNGVTNTTLANAPILHSYFNFAGDRVRNFDNFKVNLTGGGSVIQAGAPVVLTSSGSENNGTITANGEVTSENGGTVTERGFVYATTVDPTIADTKVVSGSGLGTFTGTISGLSAGTTYYLRAYATNSTGTTSYGSDLSFTTASVIAISVLNKNGGFTSDVSEAIDKYGAIGSGKGLNQLGKIIGIRDGSTAARAGLSALQIKSDYPTFTDGVYWIDVPGYGPKQTYCLMDNKYDGGGWMLAMKATAGNTFNYAATYWTSANTLNPSDVTLTNADAKYDIMNGYLAKDMMALWPDIIVNSPTVTESGSIDNLNRWSWLQNDFHSGDRITLISKFAGSQDTYYTSTNGSMSFSGYNSSIFSSQQGYSFYGINYSGYANAKVRWGFAWNNETHQDSNDVSGGIGMSFNYGDYSAGDYYWSEATSKGISRSARVEIYIR